jgi:hypothetical protein
MYYYYILGRTPGFQTPKDVRSLTTPTPVRDKLNINPDDSGIEGAETPQALKTYQHMVYLKYFFKKKGRKKKL